MVDNLLVPPISEESATSEDLILNALGLVKYEGKFRDQIAEMLPVLGTFYDGHDEGNKFLDQLVDKDELDEQGYFTLRKKFLILQLPEDPDTVGAMIVLNFKRGGSVKIGPFIVNETTRSRGIGTQLVEKAEEYLRAVGGVRKIYATTSHLNTGVNKVFARAGFVEEARYPSHYREGSEEIIWGKFIEDTEAEPVGDIRLETFAKVEESLNGTELEVLEYEPSMEAQVRQLVVESMKHWHDDVDQSFVTNMISGTERGVDFESKGKILLIARSKKDKNVIAGIATLTPKRGNPAKLYPLLGTRDAQRLLVERAIGICVDLGLRKIYTFSPEVLVSQQRALEDDMGMTDRGLIQEPYKRGANMRTYDVFV